MLVEAIRFKEMLSQQLIKISSDPFFDNLSGCYCDFNKDIQDSNWNKHQFVSLENGYNIVGYLEANIDRTIRSVDSLAIINFKKTWSPTFSKDLKEFVFLLFFRYNYEKINFFTNTNTRNEKIYDKFVNRYGGRIVGTFMRHKMLQSGIIVDCKHYEITKEAFKNKAEKLHPKEIKKYENI